jgi:hypothetical protein
VQRATVKLESRYVNLSLNRDFKYNNASVATRNSIFVEKGWSNISIIEKILKKRYVSEEE